MDDKAPVNILYPLVYFIQNLEVVINIDDSYMDILHLLNHLVQNSRMMVNSYNTQANDMYQVSDDSQVDILYQLSYLV